MKKVFFVHLSLFSKANDFHVLKTNKTLSIVLYFWLDCNSMVVEAQLSSPQSSSFSHPALCTSLTL